MLENHAKAETEKAEQFMINAWEPCKGRDRESRTVYDQCLRTMQRQRQRKQNSLWSMLENHAKAETEKAEQFMINAWEPCIGRDRESRTVYDQCFRTMHRQRQRKQNSLWSMLENHAKAETEKAEQFMINAWEPCKGRDRESRTVYDQCLRTMQRQRQRKQNSLWSMLENHAKAETEKAKQYMINASEPCKSRDRESRRGYVWSMHHAKGRDREGRKVYEQCSELCKKQRQIKQNKLWSMHHAKVRDGESRTGYGQCFRTNPKVELQSRTCYSQCTMQKAETEKAEQFMINASELCGGQTEKAEQFMINASELGKGRQRKQNSSWSMFR